MSRRRVLVVERAAAGCTPTGQGGKRWTSRTTPTRSPSTRRGSRNGRRRASPPSRRSSPPTPHSTITSEPVRIAKMAIAPTRTDASLVRRLQARDRTAWEELYAEYQPRLRAFGYRLAGNAHGADDLVQETF